MEVTFNGINATSKIFSKKDSKNICFNWDFSPNKLYAILMYDVDVPQQPSSLIHFFEINIPGIEEGDEIVPYLDPNPPDKPHRYFIDLFEQKKRINPMKITRKTDPNVIEGINEFKLINQMMIRVKP